MYETPGILIVDDLPDHIAFAGSILREQGYKVYAASSGESALKFLEKKLPDLIVLDVNMEGLSGFDVCKIIKEDPKTKDIPVIFLTAENSPEKIRKGFEIGCCDYVHKPFLKDEYLARVQTHLRISMQNRELAAAYKELNLFCSAVSHDLKAPLNVINLLIDTLKNELSDSGDEVEKIMTMIQEKSVALTKMIERLLEFSRLCNIRPLFEKLDPVKLICDIFIELKALEPERNITLKCGELPKIYGDRVLITTVFKNILSNAFKFTRKKEKAVITVSGRVKNSVTEISVKDNGAGFDMKYSDKLFGIFQRLHEQEDFEGSGVGLALIDRIMKRHGGSVKIKGEVDKGAEITLYFENENGIKSDI